MMTAQSRRRSMTSSRCMNANKLLASSELFSGMSLWMSSKGARYPSIETPAMMSKPSSLRAKLFRLDSSVTLSGHNHTQFRETILRGEDTPAVVADPPLLGLPSLTPSRFQASGPALLGRCCTPWRPAPTLVYSSYVTVEHCRLFVTPTTGLVNSTRLPQAFAVPSDRMLPQNIPVWAVQVSTVPPSYTTSVRSGKGI